MKPKSDLSNRELITWCRRTRFRFPAKIYLIHDPHGWSYARGLVISSLISRRTLCDSSRRQNKVTWLRRRPTLLIISDQRCVGKFDVRPILLLMTYRFWQKLVIRSRLDERKMEPSKISDGRLISGGWCGRKLRFCPVSNLSVADSDGNMGNCHLKWADDLIDFITQALQRIYRPTLSVQ